MIAKSPGYAAVAILTLALGIGANTTILSWINATRLNPIPGLASPREVVSLSLGRGSDNPFPFTCPDFEMMRNGQRGFVGLAGFIEFGWVGEHRAWVGPRGSITAQQVRKLPAWRAAGPRWPE